MEPFFYEGDDVFCYEPMLGRIRVLYEAKVTGVVRRRTKDPAYKLTFFNWNKIYSDRTKKCNYDHEVSEALVVKITQLSTKLMRRLTRAATNCDGDNVEKAKLIAQMLIQTFKDKKVKKLPPGLEVEDASLSSPDDHLTLLEVKKLLADKQESANLEVGESSADEYMVEVVLEDELKKILERDCLQIKSKQQVPSPPDTTILEILEAFMRHYSNNLLYEKSKSIRDTYKFEQRICLTKEVLEGIRCLFDILLPTHLLYNEELQYHERLMSGQPLPVTSSSAIVQPTSPEPVRKRQTRSSTAEATQHQVNEVTPQKSQQLPDVGVTEACKVSQAAQQLLGKLEQRSDNCSQSDCPVTKKQKLAAHLLQSNMQNCASGRSTPTQTNLQADLLMKEVNDWKLVSKEVLIEQQTLGTPLFSGRYGAIHLLRLFVQLPDILAKMRLTMERRSFLQFIFTALLSYLLEDRGPLFDNITYVPIAAVVAKEEATT